MNQDLGENYRAAFSGNRIGFGRKPALLVIDFMRAYTTPGAPLYAPGVVAAVRESRDLLGRARAVGVAVIHTNVRYGPDCADGGMFVRKIPALRAMVEGNPLAEFCDEVAPLATETVISKQYASAFFGTSLAPLLVSRGIDTTILIGCSTSGCIRATAVDAISHGFHDIVVRQCVGDRHPAPHDANLFDIDAKYGDVLDKADVLDYLEGFDARAA
jgi:maleamate amidohydrolase